ncbi:protein TolQ [Gammaproteobacteria bacterium LSUCC0057]|uniref:Tol-Pal system protein TolQ n=1 Tax=Gammaproteobacteria bacterium LSUCC0057 TaxID=2559237 RepID=A0A4Y8UP35_9GAMM|nr:protein TolQ [Gammaproteobacteria bacterium LSUCC0057]
MPQQTLSLVSLIADASLLVQAVMALLVAASVVSWVMIFQRSSYLNRAGRDVLTFEQQFWSGGQLNTLYSDIAERSREGVETSGIEHIFAAGYGEFIRLRQRRGDGAAVLAGADRAMRIAMSRENERLERHLAFLASVASVSPYIGLFGTVWGIMNSFRGLAMVQQATLATVAPGISEALVATAMGLFAAIPAVLAFNRFSAQAEVVAGQYQTFSEEFSALLHRQLHSGEE